VAAEHLSDNQRPEGDAKAAALGCCRRLWDREPKAESVSAEAGSGGRTFGELGANGCSFHDWLKSGPNGPAW